MAFTNHQFLQGLYVSYWGRGADPAGFAYWDSRIPTLGLAGIGENFAISQEGQATYPYFKTYYTLGSAYITDAMRETFVDQVYMNLFNRAPDAAGKTYWMNVLKTGQASPGRFIADVINAAIVGKNGASAADYKAMENKVAVADHFTQTMISTGTDYTDQIGAQMKPVLAGVRSDSTADEMAAAKTQTDKVISGAGASGQTYTLTPVIDNIVGTNGNDLIIGDDTSFNPADTIDGRGGVDTLRLTFDGTAGPNYVANSIKNVDIFNVQNLGAAKANLNLVNTEVTSNQQFWNDRSTADLEFRNIQDNAAIGIRGNSTAGTTTFAVFEAGAVTKDDTFNVALENAGNPRTGLTTTLDIDTQVSTKLAIMATGTNILTLDSAANTTRYSTAKFSGSGDLTITDGAFTPFVATASYDASALSGGISLDVGTPLANGAYTVTGSSVADYFRFGTFTDRTKIDGGAGKDVLQIQGNNVAALETANSSGILKANVTGIETLIIETPTAAAYNTAAFTDNYDILGVTGGAAVTTLNNVELGTSILVRDRGANDTNINYSAAGGKSDAATLYLSGNFATTTINGIEILTVTNTFASDYRYALGNSINGKIAGDSLTTVSITGGSSPTVGDNIMIDFDAGRAQAFTFTGTVGADTYTLSAGRHADDQAVFKYSAAGQSAYNTPAAIDTINNFRADAFANTTDDVLQFSASLKSGVVELLDNSVTNTRASAEGLITASGRTQLVGYDNGIDTVILADFNGDGIIDFEINLNGVNNHTWFTAENFAFA